MGGGPSSSIASPYSMRDKRDWANKQMEKAIDKGDVIEARRMRDIRDAYSRRIK